MAKIKMTVDTSGFKSSGKQYAQQVTELVEKQNQKAAKELEAMMKRLAPRKTGNLESSIVSEKIEHGWLVAAAGEKTITKKTVGKRSYTLKSGSKVRKHGSDYGKVQEYGSKTMNIPAKPFINPSRSKIRRLYNRRIRSGISRLAKKLSA